MLIDTHCHLDDERLYPDFKRIVDSMTADGLEAVITIGWDGASSQRAEGLTARDGRIYAAVGVHPQEADSANDEVYAQLAHLAINPKVVAVGEIGLDYFYENSPRERQKKVFAEQLELAQSLKLPVAIHLRDAYSDFLEIIKQNRARLTYGGVLHCYSGSAEMLREYLKFGFYVAYGGAITFKNAKHNLEAMSQTPLDRLLLETDSPYMSPVPYRGQTNEPARVAIVAKKAAEVLGLSVGKVTEITTQNAKTLFYKMK